MSSLPKQLSDLRNSFIAGLSNSDTGIVKKRQRLAVIVAAFFTPSRQGFCQMSFKPEASRDSPVYALLKGVHSFCRRYPQKISIYFFVL
jgi:hypothetical protein